MPSAKFHLSLLDSVVSNAEKLCEGEICCLWHRRKVISQKKNLRQRTKMSQFW